MLQVLCSGMQQKNFQLIKKQANVKQNLATIKSILYFYRIIFYIVKVHII